MRNMGEGGRGSEERGGLRTKEGRRGHREEEEARTRGGGERG